MAKPRNDFLTKCSPQSVPVFGLKTHWRWFFAPVQERCALKYSHRMDSLAIL